MLAGEDIKEAKPAPDIFLNAAKLLGVPARECCVVEDSSAGMQAAKAAGACAYLCAVLMYESWDFFWCASPGALFLGDAL